MRSETYSAILSDKEIDICSEKVREFLKGQKLSNREITRYALTVEEILLKTSDVITETVSFTLSFGVRFFRPFINLSIDGKPCNIFAQKDAEQSALGNSILKNLGLSPEYAYAGTENVYSFRIRKKSKNPFLPLIIALASAVCVGLLGLMLPKGIYVGLYDNLLTPLHDTFLNVLGCIAGPMVFLSVAWGIYGIGDAATLKRVGKRMLLSYIGTVWLFAAALGLAALTAFRLHFASSGGNISEISSVFTIILGIIPDNIVSPFADGNTLQIIFFAVIIGIAMLFLGQKTNAVAKAVEQINYIVQFLVEFISKLVPFFIFIVLVRMIWSDSAQVFLKVIKLFIVFLCAVLIMVISMIIYTSIRNKVNPLVIVKKGLPVLLIAITTASSAASFGTNLNVCRKEYGIDKTIISFGIPLGMVTFKPTTAISYVCLSLFFAEMYGIEVSPSWLLIMIFSAGILALATPPIPGGAITAYTVLFSQLGIPSEAIAVALACDTLIDFIATGFDQYMLSFSILNQANRLGMVNKDILKSKNQRAVS